MTGYVLDVAVCFFFPTILKPKELSSGIERMQDLHRYVPVQTLVRFLPFSIPKLDYAFEKIQETRSVVWSSVLCGFCV